MGSCASISGIDDSVVGAVGASKPIALATAGTFALGAPTVVAGKGLNTDSKVSSQVAHDFIRATVVGPSRSRSAVRMVEKDPKRFDWKSEKSIYKGKGFSVSHNKKIQDSFDSVKVIAIFWVLH